MLMPRAMPLMIYDAPRRFSMFRRFRHDGAAATLICRCRHATRHAADAAMLCHVASVFRRLSCLILYADAVARFAFTLMSPPFSLMPLFAFTCRFATY